MKKIELEQVKARVVGFIVAVCLVVLPRLAVGDLVHRWSFNDGTANDSVGAANGWLEGAATVENGQLHIPGSGRFITSAIGQSIGTKTLVVWTTLSAPANSTRGSALTLETEDSLFNTFDGIVYGECAAQKWMAGSDGWNRSQYPQYYGSEETATGEVMIAIAYDAGGSVRLYRNGVLYGSYAKGSLVTYGGNAIVQIGPRHSTHVDVYNGAVNEARIYSTALSEEQVAALYAEGPDVVISPANGDFERGAAGDAAPMWTRINGFASGWAASILVDSANPWYPDPPQGAMMVNLEINSPWWSLNDYPVLESAALGLMKLGEAYTFAATAVSTAESMDARSSTYRFSLWDATLGEEVAYAKGAILTSSTTNFVTFTTPPTDSRRAGHVLKVRLAADGHDYVPAYHLRLAVDNVTVTRVTSPSEASATWTNPAGGSWLAGGNWSGGAFADGFDAVANFSTLALAADASVWVNGPRGVGHLVFGDTSVAHNWLVKEGSGGPLTLGVASGAPVVTVSNQNTTVAVELGSAQGLVKDGTGTLTLSNARHCQGTVAVKEGTLRLGETLAHRWSFNDGTARDSVGTAHGTLYGTAAIVNGALVLNGSSGANRMETAPFGQALGTEKTLVAWCTLDDPADAQQGGGPLSVGNQDLSVFDAIVYGERLATQWMNGSDMWYRTPENNSGAGEGTVSNLVMIAIVYDSAATANKVRLFRNGMLYGEHNQGALVSFADTAKAVIGPRHVENGNPRGYMNGSVTEARVYAAALSSVEVAALYAAGPDAVPQVVPPDASVAVSSGATLNLNGGSHTVGTLAGAGAIENGSITVTGALAPGDVGQATGTLTVRSGLTLAETAALNYDYTQAGADSVQVAGTLTIQGANTVTVTPVGSELPPSRITLFTFGALAGGENLANWSVEAPGLKSYDITLNTTETSVYVRLRKIGTLVLLR